ncbi:MAG: tRNA 2-thiouridine(34) synthase MnmA [Bacteroidales bacterium]
MKIAVGLSGGVDSSVAALLLKRQGYDVFALFMQNWHDTEGTLHGACEWEEDYQVAQMVAKKIGIPIHFVDLSEEYHKRVVDYMFAEYDKGRTPNPDVLCNSEIKFDAFIKSAEAYGADVVATGHYCQKKTETTPDGQVHRIIAGKDSNKDQTYFLCQLDQSQLAKAMFPIGHLTKPEVRKIAKEAGLPSAEKKDSQGICFVGKVDLPVFLQQQLKAKDGQVVEIFKDFYDGLDAYPGYGRVDDTDQVIDRSEELKNIPVKDGDLVIDRNKGNNMSEDKRGFILSNGVWDKLKSMDGEELDKTLKDITAVYKYKIEDGKIIGKHFGAQFFTIGQRKGLNIGGHKESIFVIETNIKDNIIYVGEGHKHPGLLRKAVYITSDEIHWIREDLAMEVGESRDYLVRVRYRQPLQRATLYRRKDGMYIVFQVHQRGISAGQFAVWYDENTLEMLGSGVMSR